MKKIIIYSLFVCLIMLIGCFSTRNMKSDTPLDAIAVKALVDAQNFIFIPRYVNPLGGSRRNLDDGFEISVSKDTILSKLPYFGRAYIAPISPSDVDYSFTSTNFTTIILPVKSGWSISIKPKDQRSLQELYFKIYDNASALLTITSTDRSFISYDGYISARNPQANKK